MTHRERRELIKEIQETVAKKIAAEDLPWILESPDSGTTLYKRRFGDADKFVLDNYSGNWHSLDDLRNLARRKAQEQKLRSEHPALQDAWDNYQVLLGMVDASNS
jgi:hypothetical protein